MNIRDIAKAAQVSVSTVSKVINGKDQDISDSTRQKVQKIIQEYQYTPYANIKDNLTQTESRLIALVILDAQYLCSPFLRNVEHSVSINGFSLVLCNIVNPTSTALEGRLKVLLSKRVQGVLLCTHDPELLSLAAQILLPTPTVAICPFRSADVSTVRCDYAGAASDAIATLASFGHQRIGCLLDDSDSIVYEQIMNGITSGMGAHSIVLNDHNILLIHANQYLSESDLQNLLNRNLTAIFCQNEQQILHLYEYLLRNNISIPQSLSLICGPRKVSTGTAHIASYCIPFEDLAARSAFLLTDMINSRGTPSIQDVCLPLKYSKGDTLSAPCGSSSPTLVLGNFAYDTILSVDTLPGSGQLQSSTGVVTSPGGKCFSIAIATARLGGSPHAIGQVGDDPEGRSIISALIENGVQTDGIVVDNTSMTGRSYLTNASNGEYTIIAHSGANRLLGIKAVKKVKQILPHASTCLISTEIPFEVIKYMIQKCVVYKTTIYLKPSMAIPLDSTLLRHIDYFIPNESELHQLIPGPDSVTDKVEQLYQLGCQNVIVTLADNGCYLRNSEYALYIPAANFSPVETASAANCFIAALALMRSQGANLLYSLCYATYAAGICISQSGMYTSFPYRQQMDLYAEEINNFYIKLLKDNHLLSPP